MKAFAPPLLAVALAATLAAGPADAHDRYRSHTYVGIGVGVGGPVYRPWGWYSPWPWYDYPPVYYPPPPPPVVIQTQPPVYIEQPQAPTAAATNYWYYCAPTKGYYPYVKDCPEGWQRVSPRPTN